jgi:hypothetical protein
MYGTRVELLSLVGCTRENLRAVAV